MTRYRITCCMGCPDRFPGCHGTCEVYKTQRAEYEATMAEVKQKEYVRKGLDGLLLDTIERTNRRIRRKGR
jgi:hypothetical protein